MKAISSFGNRRLAIGNTSVCCIDRGRDTIAVMRTSTAFLLCLFAAGCVQTRTYQLSVSNQTTEPLTIGLTKIGGPFEREWAAPEDAAIAQQEPDAQMWAVIPAGKTGDTPAITGKFDSDALAVLRVYQGKLNLSGILAISRGQPNRLDLPLHPGLNRLVITQKGTQLFSNEEGGVPAVNH